MSGGSISSPGRSPTLMPAPGTRTKGQGGVGDRTDSAEKKDATCLTLPCPMLDKETLLEHLPSLATAALLGITAINVLSSNQSLSGDDTTKYRGLRQLLLSMPYTLFLFALVGLAAAFAVKRKSRMLGCATGVLLAQLLCLVTMGGIVTLVRGEVDWRIVWSVTAVIVVVVVVVWSFLCAYPKCLKRLLFCFHSRKTEKCLKRFLICFHSRKKEKVENSEDKCETCGGIVVNGTSPNPAREGAQWCETCGGVAPTSSDRVISMV